MDIFLINTSEIDNFSEDFLLKFQKKDIRNKKTLMTHCLTYAMLDSILREKYNLEEREIVFYNGKPLLKNKKKYFSISHSCEKIAIAFSDFDCGIDIEKMKNRDFDAIAKRMNFACKNLEEFYQCWTLFEAEYKLNKKTKNKIFFKIEDFALTVVSSDQNENFEIYYN